MKITVVGAGIIGCAVAYELASRGAQVVILDARAAGGGATQASGGVLAPYIEGHTPSLLTLGLSSLALYDGFVARVRSQTNQEFEYGRIGTLQVALSRDEAASLAKVAADLEKAGAGCSLLDGPTARRLEPTLSETVVAALRVSNHGYVTAPSFTSAIADAATAHGATIRSAHVTDVKTKGGSVSLTTSAGVVESDAVVFAAGSWSSNIAPSLPVKPIRGQMLHLSVTKPVVSQIVWRGTCFVVPWQDGTVLVGATVEDVGFDERSTIEGVRAILDAALALVPALSDASLLEVRAGLRPHTPDELPVIGRSSTMPGVFYATGHYRSGVLLAPLTASLIADLVIDGCSRPELALVRPDRFGL